MIKLALVFPGTQIINEDLKDLTGKTFAFAGKTPAEIINTILPFVFVIAGLILFFMFIFGGFTIFTSAGNPEKIKKGQGIIVNALIGFAIIFAAYWIIQLLELTLGINLLGAPSPLPSFDPCTIHNCIR